MGSKRRRAYNFTDFLTGYHQKINNEEVNQMSQALLEHKPDYIRNKQDEENKSRNLNNRSQGSIILAGHTPKQQHPFLADSCNITEESMLDEMCSLPIKPDLNKCIDLFQNAYVSKECSLEEASNIASEITHENINICNLSGNKTERQNISKLQRSVSLDSLKTVINRDLARSKSDTLLKKLLKRDTNYNIKVNQNASSPEIAIKNCNGKIEIVSSFNGPMTSHRKDYTIENDNTQASNDISSKEDSDILELIELLQGLKVPKSVKQTPMQHYLLRRLSVDCQNEPMNFTERLLTIAEESVINDNSFQCSDISLHMFRKRLQEVSKLIEDETVPEWPQSPDKVISTCTKGKSQEFISKSLAFTTSHKNLCSTCIPSQCNIKNMKKLHRYKSESTLIKNLHDSTNTFESLEAYCKQLYPDEYKVSSLREETQFQSQSMDDIWSIYKNQMASLEETFDIYEEVQKAKTSPMNLANQNNMSKMQNLEHKVMPHDKFDRTIMYEIAQKRQRCITTAKTLIDIDVQEKTMGKVCPKLVIDEPSLSVTDKTIEVLARVKTYQDCLEKYKSYLHQEKFNKPYHQQENMESDKVLNDNFDKCTLSHLSTNKETLQAPKLLLNKMSTNLLSVEPHSRKTDLQPRLFLTPGKSPVKNNSGNRPTGKYFSNLSPKLNTEKQSNMKFQAGKIYSQMGNYDHVVSPVGMYIKGAKSLKKNEPSKTNEMLFNPKEKQTLQSPRH